MSRYFWHRLLIVPAFLSPFFLAIAPAIATEPELVPTPDQPVGLQISQNQPTVTPVATSTEQSAEGQSVAERGITPVERAIAPLEGPSTVAQLLESRFMDGQIDTVPPDEQLVLPEFTQSESAQLQPAAPVNDAALDQMTQYPELNEVVSGHPMGQITSVTQFSDVQPTDWAYQALQSLVERYGCIVGYPDGTYRGQRALTRFEFAAGMNACLDRISELLAASTADLATKEDLATLQRLQEEFAAELATLRGRVDVLDARVSNLEANQFSTTTKLSGETIFAVADLFGGGLDDVDDSNLDETNNTIFGSRARLAFDTSFSGEDRLRVRLEVGNFERFNTTDGFGNAVIGNEARLGFDTGTDNEFQLNTLSYLFPVSDNIEVMLAAQVSNFTYFDFINTISPFASSGRGAISRFGRYNPIYRTASGAGAGVSFDFDFASLQLAYLAGESGDPSPGSGLFNGDYGALAQITIKPFDAITLALTYVNSYAGSQENDDGTFSAVGLNTGTGSSRSRVRVGDAPVVANSYGASINFRVARFLQIGGWATFSAVRVIETGDADVWTYAGTIGFPDLGSKGSLLGFVIGVQPYLAGTTGFQVSGLRSDDNGLHLEAFYRYQLNDNISITPGVVVLTAPNNDLDNEPAVLGAIRTTFTF